MKDVHALAGIAISSRTRAPVGEGGEKVGCADDAVAVEVGGQYLDSTFPIEPSPGSTGHSGGELSGGEQECNAPPRFPRELATRIIHPDTFSAAPFLPFFGDPFMHAD